MKIQLLIITFSILPKKILASNKQEFDYDLEEA